MQPLFWNIFRSPLGDYCDELADPAAAYPDDVLRRIRDDGFNAIWLRIVLRDCVQTEIFPELAPQPFAVDRLREIVSRCSRQGLRVFVYLNEPLGFPEDDPFWDNHPALRGQLDSSFDDGWDRANACCTSQPETLHFLEQTSRRLWEAVPGLAGVILITASEHLTHCYSHESKYLRKVPAGGEAYPLRCPHCAARKPWEIVGEIVSAITRGLRAVAPTAEVIVWNWSWSYYEKAPQTALISALPPSVSVMADFERGGVQHLELPGRNIELKVDEYSLGYAGPSESFQAIAREIQGSGRKLLAKLQVGTTHEIATAPNLPLIPNLVAKLRHLQSIQADGIVATWCLGTFPSLNTFAVGWILEHPGLDEDATLTKLAEAYFPGGEAGKIAAAWKGFSRAFAHFPQIQDFLYAGPVNAAPAYPWSWHAPALPMRPSWHAPEPYGSVLDEAFGPLSRDEMITCFDQLLRGWRESLAVYADGLSSCLEPPARTELNVARMIGHQLASTRNLMVFHRCRQDGDSVARDEVIDQEIAELEAILPLLDEDLRLGFHQGCFPKPRKFFDRASVEHKLADLRKLSPLSR